VYSKHILSIEGFSANRTPSLSSVNQALMLANKVMEYTSTHILQKTWPQRTIVVSFHRSLHIPHLAILRYVSNSELLPAPADDSCELRAASSWTDNMAFSSSESIRFFCSASSAAIRAVNCAFNCPISSRKVRHYTPVIWTLAASSATRCSLSFLTLSASFFSKADRMFSATATCFSSDSIL
jgi:hypothetical protein